MRIGLHVSIAGGFTKAAERALALGCETIQVFTRSPRGWQAAGLDAGETAGFRAAVTSAGIAPVFVHAPYLVNLATTDRALAARSCAVLAEELDRAAAIGALGVVVHPGHAADRDRAPARTARRVAQALRRSRSRTLLLLENTAGAATDIGSRFADLAAIIAAVAEHRASSAGADRLGVALDTAHLLAAGAEIRTRAGLDMTLRDFDAAVGLARLHLLHLNDSRFGLGSGRDRHWHIGRGEIGLDGFRTIINHPLLRHLPAILETPRSSAADDRRNLAAVRSLLP